MDNEPKIVDYTDSVEEPCEIAQGKDKLFIIIYKTEHLRQRYDGVLCGFEISVCYLSKQCEHSRDGAWYCQTGSTLELWSLPELIDHGFYNKDGKPKSCFPKSVLFM